MPHEPFCNIVVHRLYHLLEAHPDKTLVEYVMDGFTHGFNIGVEGPVGLGRATNMQWEKPFRGNYWNTVYAGHFQLNH